jgi:squalene-associated FAD-dependent desaturase
VGGAAQPGGGVQVSGSVVVVGGGLAGVTAALDCARAGQSVTLVEVRPRLGGAVYSFERDGLWLDNGQHVFLRCCDAYRSLLGRLGTSKHTVLQDRLAIPVLAPGRSPAWLRRTGLPAPLHLAGSLLRYRHLPLAQRLSAVRAARALARVPTDQWAADEASFGAWLRGHRQGPQAIDALWELIARPTLNLRADDASLASAAFVFRVGLLERADAGDIGYARRPLQRVHGDAALRALRAKGVDVRLGWRASAIEASDDRRLTVAGPGERLDADAVVVAVPHQRAARLLPEGALRDRSALDRLGTSPIVNLHVFYDRRVLNLEFAAAVNSPVQYVFDRTEAVGLERGQCLAVSLSAAEEEVGASAEELRGRFESALAELLPAARGARVERFVVTREHAATFRAAPGHRALRPGPRTGVDGLTLAGAYTDTGWPATMEGAVRSGHHAAEIVLQSLGAPRAMAEVAA